MHPSVDTDFDEDNKINDNKKEHTGLRSILNEHNKSTLVDKLDNDNGINTLIDYYNSICALTLETSHPIALDPDDEDLDHCNYKQASWTQLWYAYFK